VVVPSVSPLIPATPGRSQLLVSRLPCIGRRNSGIKGNLDVDVNRRYQAITRFDPGTGEARSMSDMAIYRQLKFIRYCCAALHLSGQDANIRVHAETG
jgi:hypothetical protein